MIWNVVRLCSVPTAWCRAFNPLVVPTVANVCGAGLRAQISIEAGFIVEPFDNPAGSRRKENVLPKTKWPVRDATGGELR
jgi:hypothetical protein